MTTQMNMVGQAISHAKSIPWFCALCARTYNRLTFNLLFNLQSKNILKQIILKWLAERRL